MWKSKLSGYYVTVPEGTIYMPAAELVSESKK